MVNGGVLGRWRRGSFVTGHFPHAPKGASVWRPGNRPLLEQLGQAPGHWPGFCRVLFFFELLRKLSDAAVVEERRSEATTRSEATSQLVKIAKRSIPKRIPNLPLHPALVFHHLVLIYLLLLLLNYLLEGVILIVAPFPPSP